MNKYIVGDESHTVDCIYDTITNAMTLHDKITGNDIPIENDLLKELFKKYINNFESNIGYFTKIKIKHELLKIETEIRYKEFANES